MTLMLVFINRQRLAILVWNDVNGNGLQDGGELGISGVTVTLYDTMDTKITDTTTNASGHYTFTNVVPNTYYLHFAGPTGYLASPKEQGSTPRWIAILTQPLLKLTASQLYMVKCR